MRAVYIHGVGFRFRECTGFLRQVLPEKIPYHEGYRLRFCRPSVREELKPELMPPLAPEVYLSARSACVVFPACVASRSLCIEAKGCYFCKVWLSCTLDA